MNILGLEGVSSVAEHDTARTAAKRPDDPEKLLLFQVGEVYKHHINYVKFVLMRGTMLVCLSS